MYSSAAPARQRGGWGTSGGGLRRAGFAMNPPRQPMAEVRR